VSVVAGCGLEGDRHFRRGQRPGGALTLIEAKVLEDVELTGPESRRQLVVRGVRLNELAGKRFRVGEVECLGFELCEPCLHLQSLTRPGIIDELVHRGGLNADVLSSGTVAVGDPVVVWMNGRIDHSSGAPSRALRAPFPRGHERAERAPSSRRDHGRHHDKPYRVDA
jgi:MOSC domain-containing protein YiiM